MTAMGHSLPICDIGALFASYPQATGLLHYGKRREEQERLRKVLVRHLAGGAARAAQLITGQGLPLDNSTAASASRC